MNSASFHGAWRDRRARWFAAAALLALSAVAADASAPQTSQSIREAPGQFNAVRHGMTPSEVLFIVGAPSERFPGDVWVYWHCVPKEPGARPLPYDTMVLRFVNQRLADVKLIEGKALRTALAAQRTAVARK